MLPDTIAGGGKPSLQETSPRQQPPPAANTSGYATVCSQGEVRGGSGPAPVTTYDPYQCSDPYLCTYDTYDPLIVIDPDWGIDIGGGGRPGGGGGIGPR